MAKTPQPKSQVVAARQLFLYGNGDGKRIIGAGALAEASGVHIETIRRWMPRWQKEYEEMLSHTSEGGLAIRLSADDMRNHSKDMDFLRNDLNSIKWEMDNLDETIAQLEGICNNFALNSENGERALAIFDSYLRASLNKSNLRRQFLTTQKQWAEMVGVVDLKDIQVTAQKALETGRAKLKIKSESVENQRDVTPRPDAQSVFDR